MKEYMSELMDSNASEGVLYMARAAARRFEDATGHGVHAATVKDVDVFKEYLKGYISEQGGSHGAKATARQYMMQVRRIAAFYGKDAAVRRFGELKLNRVFEIHTRSADIVAADRGYTEDELQQIVAYARKHAKQAWVRPVILLLAATGCRVSEIAGLRSGDIGPEYATLHITGKGRRERTVSVGLKAAREALKGYVENERESSGSEGFVFCSGRFGAPPHLRTATIRVEVNKMLRELGLKKRGKGAHGMRHALFSAAARNGVAPKVIQAQAGHSSLQTTMNIYVHTQPEQVQEQFEALWGGE